MVVSITVMRRIRRRHGSHARPSARTPRRARVQASDCSTGHSVGPPSASARIASMAGDIGCARTPGCSQSGNTSIGTIPELKNRGKDGRLT